MSIGPYDIAECWRCTHRYLDQKLSLAHTEKQYSDEYFEGGGAGYTDYLSQEKLVTSYGHTYAGLLRKYSAPGKMLDVGSAAGFFMKGLCDRGWDVMGIEPNRSMAEESSRRFGFETRNSSIEESDLPPIFDLVTLVQVIGHFHDVSCAVEKSAGAIRPGGLFLVETWNFKSLPARGFGKAWHEYSPPTVVNWFSPQSLTLLSQQFGLRHVASGRPNKKVTAKHAASLIGHSIARFSGVQCPRLRSILTVIPESVVLPYPSFDVFWALFKKG